MVKKMEIEKFIEGLDQSIVEYFEDVLNSIDSFEDEGVLTRDKGFVIRMVDGSQFQITIVKSKEEDGQ